jgi:lipopolysaccharide biosynthesis regulator YciM
MEFDFQWLLVGLPVAFLLGWLASKLDLRQLRREHKDAPKAYFKGLNLLLNEQQDKAIDAFIEAVQNDPDTAELHFALGNLFRRRGEFERAVRVHQHLVSRADLPALDRQRAQHALAQDFMKAGLFDRAEAAYGALEGSAFATEAKLALLNLHERARGWRAAAETAASLERSGLGSFGVRIAHYWCEIAEEADASGRIADADAAVTQALLAAPRAARPLILAGERELAAGRPGNALVHWNELRKADPERFHLVAQAFAKAGLACDRAESTRLALLEAYEQVPGLALLKAINLLEAGDLSHSPRLLAHMQTRRTLGAAMEMLGRPDPKWSTEEAAVLRLAVSEAARPLQRYRCAACGFEAQRRFWQCPGCLSWDSFPAHPLEEN